MGGRIDGVDDPCGLFNELLPELGGDEYLFLGLIDLYGDTTFNHLQMRRFLKEWAWVLLKAASADELAIALAVEALARRQQVAALKRKHPTGPLMRVAASL